MSYKFTFDGVEVEYFPAVMRTQLARRRILISLVSAYEYESGESVPSEDFANFTEYAEAMSQCSTTAPWWVNSMATPEQVREAYELFLEQPPELYVHFVMANSATMPPKKTS